jgi:anti-sigma factor RsiW
MNCRDIEEFRPLYLSEEMDEGQRELFRSHLAECRRCAAEMDRQTALDRRLRDAVSAELPDATAIQSSVRARIRGARVRRWTAVAAAVLFAALLGYRTLRPEPVARLYADAALDHRQEVTEHQPRRWRSDPVEIEKLAGRYQLSNVAALAPAGYRLEHAKMCGIDGKPALHLVYTNGAQEFSLFVRARTGRSNALRTVRVGSEKLAAFQTARLEAVVATSASSGDCLEFARFAEGALL